MTRFSCQCGQNLGPIAIGVGFDTHVWLLGLGAFFHSACPQAQLYFGPLTATIMLRPPSD